MKSGFGLVGLLIVLAIIALLVWGGSSYTNSRKNVIDTNLKAKESAEALKEMNDARNAQFQNELNK